MVRRGRMRVGSDQQAGPAIGDHAHGHFFGTDLSMKINKYGIAIPAQLALVKFPPHRRKRVIKHGLNHDPAHGIHHQHPLAFGRFHHAGTTPRAAHRPVQGADEVWLALDKNKRLPLVKGVVPRVTTSAPAARSFW